MTIDDKTLTAALRAASRLTVTDAEREEALRRLHRGIERHRRERLRATVAAVVAAVLVVGGGVVWLADRGAIRSIGPSGAHSTTRTTLVVDTFPSERTMTDGFFGPTTQDRAVLGTDGFPDNGLVGIPAVGMVPSSPETGKRVGGYWLLGGRPFQGAVTYYDDGRMIWNRTYSLGSDYLTGFVEQRLTPEGLRLALALNADPWELPDLLPATAWADQTIRPWVPWTFELCAGIPGSAEALPPSELSRFPQDVAAVLRERGHRFEPDAGDEVSDLPVCVRVSTDEARSLAGSLRRAGFAPYRDSYEHYETPWPGTLGRTTHAGFEPVMPDGTTGCSPCR
jgi:hypothetical protein